jgi:hypothetical protein
MNDTIETTKDTVKQYQCRHIFTDGHRCGSPCLRGEDLCYYHHTTRRPVANPNRRPGRRSTFELPLPEDRSAIQHSIGEVLRRIASNDIDPRRAGLLLYGLQIASLNLPKPATHGNAKPIETVEEITTHPELGVLAPRAEVGKATQRKSPVALLLERIMQSEQEAAHTEPGPEAHPEPATVPSIQAVEAPPAPAIEVPEKSRRVPAYAGAPITRKSAASSITGTSHPHGGRRLMSTCFGPHVCGSYGYTGVAAFSIGSTIRHASST